MNPYCPYFFQHHFGPSFGADPFGPPTGPFGTVSPSGTGLVAPSTPGALGAAASRPGTRLPIQWEQVRLLMAQHRGSLVAQAQAAGYTTRIRCAGFGAFHCPLYDVVPSSERPAYYDLRAIARVPDGATGLYANLAGRQRLAVANIGAATLYPVVWIDAPGGEAVYGWMLDGGFGIG